MNPETEKAVLIQRGINTFDVEIRDTTGRSRDLIIGGRSFSCLKEAELFIHRLTAINTHTQGATHERTLRVTRVRRVNQDPKHNDTR